MNLPVEAIREFQEAWRASGLGELSFEEASCKAQELLYLYSQLTLNKYE